MHSKLIGTKLNSIRHIEIIQWGQNTPPNKKNRMNARDWQKTAQKCIICNYWSERNKYSNNDKQSYTE